MAVGWGGGGGYWCDRPSPLLKFVLLFSKIKKQKLMKNWENLSESG